MIEKIEITQRFNFKRLNRHYECFTIDFVNNMAYYKISERGSGDKFLHENSLCDDSWVDILVDLRRKMTSEIHRFSDKQADELRKCYLNLELFKDYESEKFSYFERLELIYSCIVIIYSTDAYEEYSFKNNFPKNWINFGELLKDFFNFDVLHLDYQRQLATPLYYDFKRDGIYFNDAKLKLKDIEFGHYRCYPYELPNPRLIINFEDKSISGYIDKQLTSDGEEIVLNLLEKYHVYLWTQFSYHLKSQSYCSNGLEGYEWYLEIVFEGDVIWHLFGYNDYPDTYVQLARDVKDITGMDLLEIDTIDENDIKLFEKYGNAKLG
ncbi:hypothetical protein [Methanobrevibacter sp.]|uniref:hypothetical protein n=1 Tax=Methanobrevibacter sp. TaxID=66852 RepID=UPI0025FF0FA5|nr:hypothetical protein [Methanobrevibacter sp.]MBQ6512807.1 hypothetical protein [Methanobrevibacter sp.]